MRALKFYKGLIPASLVFLSLMAAPVQSMSIYGFADAGTITSKVLLMATLNNGPAMKPVTWTVYRLENGKEVYDRSINRHSANIELTPGFYRADVTLNDGSISRSRVFDLSNVRSSNVIVAMD